MTCPNARVWLKNETEDRTFGPFYPSQFFTCGTDGPPSLSIAPGEEAYICCEQPSLDQEMAFRAYMASEGFPTGAAGISIGFTAMPPEEQPEE